jgi:ABC-type sugar transport system permease subunit
VSADPASQPAIDHVPAVPAEVSGGRAAAILVAVAPVLQLLIALAAGAAALVLVVAGPVGVPLPVFLFLLAIPVLFAVGGLLSAVWLLQRHSRGRVLAIIVDYFVLFGVVIAFLHVAGLFAGLDDLADSFQAGLPWLALALVSFLLSYAVDAFAKRPSLHRPLVLARRALLALAGVGWFIAVGGPQFAVDLVVSTLTTPAELGLLLAGLALLGMLLALWGPAGRARYGAPLRDAEVLNGVLLVSPNILGFLAFFAGPLLFSLYVSLADWDAFSTPVIVGLQNYIDILSFQLIALPDPAPALAPGLNPGFTEILRVGPVALAAQDKLFWISLRNIILFSLIAIPLAVIPALLIASLLNSKVRGVRFFRAIYFVPAVAGVVGVAIIWKQLLDQSVGWINYLITLSVDWLNATFGLALTDPQIGWLSDPGTALPAIAIVFAWTQVGFNAIRFLAGLQGIPEDLYEASSIDGANRWQRFRNVTLPMVAPTTFFVVATTGILAMQLFTEPYVLTSPTPGGPNNATLTPVMYLYNTGYQQFEFGYASAVAWVLFALIFVFTLAQYRRQRRDAAAFGG